MRLRPPQRMKIRRLPNCHSEPRPEQRPERSASVVEGRGRRAERSGVKNLHLCNEEILRYATNELALCHAERVL